MAYHHDHSIRWIPWKIAMGSGSPLRIIDRTDLCRIVVILAATLL